MAEFRTESDSLGEVRVPADKLWGAQTQRSLEHFCIGKDLIPREMIHSYAILKKAAAIVNQAEKRLVDEQHGLIVQTCDEILAGQHHDMFPLHVWMTGSGTQFNMNVNEAISNRCCQLAGTPLGSKTPVHPNHSWPRVSGVASCIWGATDLDDVLPLVCLGGDGVMQRLHRQDEPFLRPDRRGDVHRRRKGSRSTTAPY